MFFPPLILLMMLAFFVAALILLPFLLLGMIGQAFLRLGLPPGLIFWLLISTLVGSLVNIPIYRFESREVVADQVISYFGMQFRPPSLGPGHQTVLAVNVGGALIPLGLCIYLLIRIPFGWYLPVLVALVTVVVNRRPARSGDWELRCPDLSRRWWRPWEPISFALPSSGRPAPTLPVPWGFLSAATS